MDIACRLVGDAIIAHKDVFLVWNYGGALVVDGLWEANVTFDLNYAEEVGELSEKCNAVSLAAYIVNLFL